MTGSAIFANFTVMVLVNAPTFFASYVTLMVPAFPFLIGNLGYSGVVQPHCASALSMIKGLAAAAFVKVKTYVTGLFCFTLPKECFICVNLISFFVWPNTITLKQTN